MATSKLTQLAGQYSQQDLERLSPEALAWLKKKIQEVRYPSKVAQSIARENFRFENNFKLGRLYCFYYDPKTKEDLPYYDRFPMVLILDRYDDGFLGLNLHYLPYQYRVAFLKKLFEFAVLNKDDEIKRLRVTYDILTASRRLREFRPCIKRYLFSQVQSRLLTIQPNEWEIATLLPLQQFKKARATTVWRESIEEIRKN
jgi:hypothetical protein